MEEQVQIDREVVGQQMGTTSKGLGLEGSVGGNKDRCFSMFIDF